MNKTKFILITISLFFVINIFSQETKFDNKDLLGEWNAYQITTLKGGDGSDITLDGKPFDKKVMMNFIDSKIMFFSMNGSEEHKIEYHIKNNKLIIAHRKYTIQALTDSILTLKEEKLLGNLIYLKKDDG